MEEFMKTCIIQLDHTANRGFVWSDDMEMLLNILKTIYPELDFDQMVCGDSDTTFIYESIDYTALHNLVSLVFDRVIVDVSEETWGDIFHEQCIKKVESLNENT
jgi:hypothetical protein